MFKFLEKIFSKNKKQNFYDEKNIEKENKLEKILGISGKIGDFSEEEIKIEKQKFIKNSLKNFNPLERKLKNINLKVLVLADRAPYESIKDILEKNKDIKLIITLGDLVYYDISYLQDVNIPKIGIYGNHCDGFYLEQLGITNLHLKTFEIKGIKFGGFEGSIKYKESKYLKMYSQKEAEELFKNFEKVDVLITHNPPFGIQDDNDNAHIGFKTFNNYIKNKNPKYLLHGHTYPKDKKTIYMNTEVLYIYGSEIIELKF